MKSLLLLALGLARTVVLGARIEAERIVVSVRPYKREQRRCPVCGRACDFYDMANRGAPRLWRAMDLARSACYLEYAPCRVRCPEHGVRTEAVPWARHGARFTRDFEDWVAWLAVRCTASVCLATVFSTFWLPGSDNLAKEPPMSQISAFPSIKALSILLLVPLNSTSLPWWTTLSIIAEASLSSPRIVPHLLNSMLVVNTTLRFS